METKRTKLWRRKQGFRVFKARMVYYASFERNYWCVDGSQHVPQHWFELAKEHWTQVYRSTGTITKFPPLSDICGRKIGFLQLLPTYFCQFLR